MARQKRQRKLNTMTKTKRMYAVINGPAGEGVIFEDRPDAEMVASGRLRGAYPSIAHDFLDSYPDGNTLVAVDVPDGLDG
jgi:hypothetical protein